MPRRLYAIAAVGLLAAACGSATSARHESGPAASRAVGAPIAAASVSPGRASWAAFRDGTVAVAADRSWRTFKPPQPPAKGDSITVSGSTVLVASLPGGLTLNVSRSTDAGRTWHVQSARLNQAADSASVSSSPDGRRVAVAAAVPGLSGAAGGYSQLFVGASGGRLAGVTAPGGPDVAWVGDKLLVPGGPLRSRLYLSSDHGRTWSPRAVGGAIAPSHDVSPDVPAIGEPIVTSGGTVVSLTRHAGGRSEVALYRTVDGSRYSRVGTIAAGADVGPGVSAVVSPYGPGGFVVADPTTTALHVYTGGATRTLSGRGLPGPVDSLSFQTASSGLAQVTVRACAQGKAGCTDELRLYRSDDGGATWTRTTP